jgi:hypothetical protein
MNRYHNIIVNEGTPTRRSHLDGLGLVIACDAELSLNVNTQIITVVLLLRRCLVGSEAQAQRALPHFIIRFRTVPLQKYSICSSVRAPV